MSNIFSLCNSLMYLPDISNLKTDNVEDMNNMFYECNSLIYLPNISENKPNKNH